MQRSRTNTWSEYPENLMSLTGKDLSTLHKTEFPQLHRKGLDSKSDQATESSDTKSNSGTSGRENVGNRNRPRFTYVDHAGATIYSRSQIQHYSQMLLDPESVVGNPHSSEGGRDTEIDCVRRDVLSYFGVSSSTHAVIFNSGATAGLKTIGECFNWNGTKGLNNGSNDNTRTVENLTFMHTVECHTSLLGIRQYAVSAGAEIVSVRSDDLQDTIAADKGCKCPFPGGRGLLAFPGECNFSGNHIDLKIVAEARDKGWAVLFDAAKYAATAPLDLSKVPADFVSISFYKMFGFPTGLGALIMRNDALHLLQRTYFGGGTLLAASSFPSNISRQAGHTQPAMEPLTSSTRNPKLFHRLAEDPTRRFEDGTIDFLSIRAVPYGLDLLRTIDPVRISKHTSRLSKSLANHLKALRHETTGTPVCHVYGRIQGSIVAFNVLGPSGKWVGYSHVAAAAASCCLKLRTGCFCNPGACQVFLNISAEETINNFKAGHVCSDNVDLIDGKPTGAVRVSFGYMSTDLDVQSVVNFIVSHFLETDSMQINGKASTGKSINCEVSEAVQAAQSCVIQSVHIYPIKSCGGIELKATGDVWELTESGLLYDREWAIIVPSPSSTLSSPKTEVWRVLRQKECPKMCQVHTQIKDGWLIVTAPGISEHLHIPLSRVGQSSYAEKNDDFISNEGVLNDRARSGHDHFRGTTPDQEQMKRLDLINCGRRCRNIKMDDIVPSISVSKRADVWFTRVLGLECRLVRAPDDNTSLRRAGTENVNFSNEKQLLLVNTSSVNDLKLRLKSFRESTIVQPFGAIPIEALTNCLQSCRGSRVKNNSMSRRTHTKVR